MKTTQAIAAPRLKLVAVGYASESAPGMEYEEGIPVLANREMESGRIYKQAARRWPLLEKSSCRGLFCHAWSKTPVAYVRQVSNVFESVEVM
jgi:hypothetical protein